MLQFCQTDLCILKKIAHALICISLMVKVKVTQSCLTLQPHRLYSPWNSPGQNTGVGSLSLLQGIFPTHRLNSGLPHGRWILSQLSHQESPKCFTNLYSLNPYSNNFMTNVQLLSPFYRCGNSAVL